LIILIFRIIRKSLALDFFFSSRRRHTRFSRDWSSDVCSSDLTPALGLGVMAAHRFLYGAVFVASILISRNLLSDPRDAAAGLARSEERRVGKVGKSRG